MYKRQETGDDTGFTDIGQDGSIPRTSAVDYERSGVRAGYGSNLRTGEECKIRARTSVKFKASEILIQKLNPGK